MGISGLLPLLKSIQQPVHLRKFAGQVIGIDAYGWLHRGAHTCGVKLALGQPTTQYVEFCMKRVHMLIHFGVTPYLVFDGDYLPSKAETEKERALQRQEAKRVGMELLKTGKTSQAYQELGKAVDITPEVAALFIEELKRANVQYVVAPYEADAQMVYLEQKGIISAILSEDSDLLVFGAKCLLTKLDQYGECTMVRRQDFTACREISLVGWTDAEFRRMAILSGCDYLKNASSMGLKTAYRHVRKYKTVDRIVQAAKFDGKIKFPPGYLEAFAQAERTFLHQWVFCPDAETLVNLTEIPNTLDVSDMPYIGSYVSADTAQGVARGQLHPHTKLPLKPRSGTSRSASMASMVSSIKKKDINSKFSSSSSINEAVQGKTIDTSMKGKPIDSFFRKRMPLAELDPNSFHLSPSQQRILEENIAPFTSNVAPSPNMENVPPILVPRPAPIRVEATRRTVSDSLTSALSRSHSTKRQRLCSDGAPNVIEEAAAGSTEERSRFFGAKSTTTPSRPAKKSKRSSSGFDLWSDDSIEDIMNDLPDTADSIVKPRKKLSVLPDVPVTPAVGGASSVDCSSTDMSQITAMTNSTVDSQWTGGNPTPATSIGSSPVEQHEYAGEASIFDSSIRKNMDDLRKKFTYQSTQEFDSPTLHSTHARSVASRKLTRTASAPAQSGNLIERILSKKSQDKGRRTNAHPSQVTVGQSPLNLPPSNSQPAQSLLTFTGEENKGISESEWPEMDQAIVVPRSDDRQSSSPEPVPASAERLEGISEKRICSTGSEDLLVPDSEGESDDAEISNSTGLSFDVSRFTFVPKA